MAHFKCIIAALLCLVASTGYTLQSYQATYQISVRNISAGTVRHDVILTDSTYRFDTIAKPSLAAKMLGFGIINETTIGLLDNAKVIPQHYQRSMDGDAEFRLVYDFYPKQHNISAQIGNSERVLKYDADTQPLDILSLIVQTLIDEERKKIATKYALVNDDKIRVYTVEKLPDETWQTKSGKYITIHVLRQKNGDRQTKIYLADNPLRLVELTQIKGDKIRFNFKLVDYRAI